ncbi:MAG: inositol 2-dehydrogenase [Anaerolineales bacterium]|nr:inositol 2-dehydrogenase [Anaerolineales bacterium]
MTKKINLGLIGAGRIGRLHAEHLAYHIPDANLVVVSDVDAEAAEVLAADFEIPLALTDYRRIMEDEAVEAVAICSSTDTHAQIVADAAAVGKHIFCEKPLDFDLGKIDRVLAAVEEAGVKLQVGFQRRFDDNFRRAQEIVASGEIGTPHILRITSRDPEPPPIEYIKVSGGIFLDMTIHDFDTARFLIGSEVEEMYTAGGVLVDPQIGDAGDIDTAIITLRYANGTLGTIDNSRKAVYGIDMRYEVFCSNGIVGVFNNDAGWTSGPDVQDSSGVHSSLPSFEFQELYRESYIAEMKSFVECVLYDRVPLVTAIDARMPVVMGYAAQKSLEENRPVRLSEVDRSG